MMGTNKPKILSAKDFKGKYQLAVISEVPIGTDRKSKEGNDYKSFEMEIMIEGKKHKIDYLMRGQFNNLVDQFGEDETLWKGKQIRIDAEEVGSFTNFVFYAEGQVREETIED